MKVIEIELPHTNDPVLIEGEQIEVLHDGGTIRIFVSGEERLIAYAAGRWVRYELCEGEIEAEEETNG